MKTKLKLTKIGLKTADGKEVELTLDEARELHLQLDALFGKKVTADLPYPPLPSFPIIIERPWVPSGPHWTPPMWYTGDTASAPALPGPITVTSENSVSGMTITLRGKEMWDE